jgi:hypothetical protein
MDNVQNCDSYIIYRICRHVYDLSPWRCSHDYSNGSLVKLCQNKCYIYCSHVHCIGVVYATEIILTNMNIIQDLLLQKNLEPFIH